ncbi:MAG: GNAT family protein [Pseudobdellovibrionaceae bacterium]
MMKDNFELKRWFEDDWAIYRAARLEALRLNSNVFLRSEDEESVKQDEYWREHLRDTYGSAIFGLYSGDDVIGLTGAFRWRESPLDTVILGMSYIRPEYRGRGLSRLFYEKRLEWAWAQGGITRILVAHREGNEASRAANQKWGFAPYGSEIITYGNGECAKNYKYELRREHHERI